MSDFLSNFSGENYQKLQQNKQLQKEQLELSMPTPSAIEAEEEVQASAFSASKTVSEEATFSFRQNKRKQKKVAKPRAEWQHPSQVQIADDLSEVDPTYKNKQLKKRALLGISCLLFIGLCFGVYYFSSSVKLPDFSGQELSEVRNWSTQNNVKLTVEQTYDLNHEMNTVMSQSATQKRIKKGSELTVVASLGADPEEKLSLPDFQTMTLAQLEEWIMENQADNVSVIQEYSETAEQGTFLKMEFPSKHVSASSYQRKDKVNVYYSKGKEVLEPNISMVDFAGKTKAEVEDWAKKNEVQLELKEVNSDNVEAGKVVAQSIPKEEKIAKKSKLLVEISAGKAVAVPDFSQVMMEEVEKQTYEFPVIVKQIYHDTASYGRFVFQSQAPGTPFMANAVKPTIEVNYSLGRPFIRDLRGSTLEGELPKIFYEEYQSRGANVTYQVSYVDSEATKGSVVDMSSYNEYISTQAVIYINISRGNLAAQAMSEDVVHAQPEGTDEG